MSIDEEIHDEGGRMILAGLQDAERERKKKAARLPLYVRLYRKLFTKQCDSGDNRA